MATRPGNSVRHVPPHVIGNAFAQQYYKVLRESPEIAHKFYHDESILGRKLNYSDVRFTSITTMHDINEHFLSTSFKGCSMQIDNVDCQSSHVGGLLILVSASFTMPDAVKRRFTQSFFLAPQEGGGYFVLNDMLRYEPGTPPIEDPDLSLTDYFWV